MEIADGRWLVLELYQALLPDQQRVLGADYPNTLTTEARVNELRALGSDE